MECKRTVRRNCFGDFMCTEDFFCHTYAEKICLSFMDDSADSSALSGQSGKCIQHMAAVSCGFSVADRK